MGKALKALICAVAVFWIFAAGIITGTFIVRNSAKNNSDKDGGTVSDRINIDIVTDVPPQTQSVPTTQFSLDMTTGDKVLSTYGAGETKKLSVPSGKTEITNALLNVINSAKQSDNFTAVKNTSSDFSVDSVTGGNAVKEIADGIIGKLGNKPKTTYSFSGGKDVNGSGETPLDVISPPGRNASVSASAVKSASANENTSGGYDIRLVLEDEKQTMTLGAANHNGLFDTSDLSSLSFPSAFKMTDFELCYSGCAINACVDGEGRLKSVRYSLSVVQGRIDGKVFSADITASFHGLYEVSIDITY